MAGTFSKLLYHVVFSTKRRTAFLGPALRTPLYPYLDGILRRQGGWLLAVGGMPDHVHLLLRLNPDTPISEVVRHLKGGSSKWVREQPGLCADFAWQLGYAAFSVSASAEAKVRAYIDGQENHHRKTNFRQELLGLARTHGIELDDRKEPAFRPERAEFE
jgi:REP element-mobilizing transposase RayT